MRKREMNIEIPNNKTQIPNKSQFSKFKFNGRRNQSFEFGIYCLEFICFLVLGFCYFHFGSGYAGIWYKRWGKIMVNKLKIRVEPKQLLTKNRD